MNTKLNNLLITKRKYESAAKRLEAATIEAFPEGTLVGVTLSGTRITGKVVRAGGCWWSRPSHIIIRNVDTGKERHFDATTESNALQILD